MNRSTVCLALEVVLVLVFVYAAAQVARKLPIAGETPTGPEATLEPHSLLVQLNAEPADREVKLDWVPRGLSDTSAWRYRQRSIDGAYKTWQPVPESAVVGGLRNGRIYVFQVALFQGDNIRRSSTEATVVPSVQEQPKVEERLPRGTLCDGEDRLGEVFFSVDSSEIDLGLNQTDLASIAGGLVDSRPPPDKFVLVVAYASPENRASYNLDLSERRATAVIAYLNPPEDATDKFIPLAMGEWPSALALDRSRLAFDRSELAPNPENERHRKVVVALCQNDTAS